MSSTKPTVLPIVSVALGFILTEEMVITVADRIADPNIIASRGHPVALDRYFETKGERFCLLPTIGTHPITGRHDSNLFLLVWDFYPSLNGYFSPHGKTPRNHVEKWFIEHGGIEGINLEDTYTQVRAWPFRVCLPAWVEEKIDAWLYRLNKQRRIPALIKKPSKEEAKNMMYLQCPPQLSRPLRILTPPASASSSTH